MKYATGKFYQLVLLCLVCSVILSLFSGCSTPVPQKKTELWVVTERSSWDRMNGQIEVVKKAYQKEHKNMTIRIDYLPTESQARDVYLQKLRTEILQGGGPDCYLLPTDNTLILDEPIQYTYIHVEPLFADVEHAMRNGLFYDIAKFYEVDDTLGKDALNTKIMDAGVVDGARYVLPLRYDIPMIYAIEPALEEAGLDPAVLSQDICTIMEAVYETGDPILAGGILYEDYSAFSYFIDYGSGNATLDEETLYRYMADYQKLKTLLGSDYSDEDHYDIETDVNLVSTSDVVPMEPLDIKKYIYLKYANKDYLTEYYPLWIGTMQGAFEYVPFAASEEVDLTMVPLKTADTGEVVAKVCYYAAVGSGCDDPEIAYDFLRQFLLEDSQWEKNRPKRSLAKPVKGDSPNTSLALQYPGLIENGWPVRDTGSVNTLWNVRRKQFYIRSMSYDTPKITRRRMRKVGRTQLEEEDVPLFDIPIGQVRFNTTLSEGFADVLSQLNDSEDIAKLAQQLVWNLRWHVSEG